MEERRERQKVRGGGEEAGKMIQNSTATWELKNEREESDRQTDRQWVIVNNIHVILLTQR